MNNFFKDLQNELKAEELMSAAIAKFGKYGRGVYASPYTKGPFRSDGSTSNESNWTDLTNTNLVSIGSLKGLCGKYGNRIAQHVNDPAIFGDVDTVFIHTTPRGQDVRYTAEDCYLLCRAAILEQQSTKEYVAAVNEREALNATLEGLETASTKRKKAAVRLKELNAVLEPSVSE